MSPSNAANPISSASAAGQAYVEKIKALNADPNTEKLIDRLYGSLTILDAKAGGLLGVNGVLAAVLGVLLTWWISAPAVSLRRFPPLVFSEDILKIGLYSVALFDLVLIAIAAFICMLIVRIKWGFSRMRKRTGRGSMTSQERS